MDRRAKKYVRAEHMHFCHALYSVCVILLKFRYRNPTASDRDIPFPQLYNAHCAFFWEISPARERDDMTPADMINLITPAPKVQFTTRENSFEKVWKLLAICVCSV